ALSAAHRKGIVHRDLKPANVMLTKSGVKLLDFGLAKAASEVPEGSTSEHTAAAADVTREGTIIGTLAYMSPEQLEGRAADARSDIFALGATLYEMATGRKAFEASSQAGLISAILSGEPPPVSSVQPMSPPALDRIVRGCLAKDPDARWQTAHDVGLQLAGLGDSGTSSASAAGPRLPRGRGALPWAVAVIAAALAAVALWRGGRSAAAPAPTIRFPLLPPPGRAFFTTYESIPVAISPDGSRIAFVSAPFAVSAARRGIASPDAPGTRGIWVRDLATLDARPVRGTEDATSLFWSPDGKSLGFFVPGKLKRILLAEGAAAVPICDLPSGGGRSGTWSAGGDILFASIQARIIFRVPAAGGAPEKAIEASADEVRVAWPWFLPDGRRFLYLVRLRDTTGRLMLGEIGKPSRTLAPIVSSVQYVDPGYIVFVREGALLAQPFDAAGGRLTGEPISIAEPVSYFLSTGRASFAASRSGTLVYQSHDDVSRLTWFDLAGRALDSIGPPANYLNLDIAREGRRVFYDRTRTGIGTFDIWSLDLDRGVETPITTETETEVFPLDLPGGKSIVYSANRGGAPELFRRSLESGAEERLTKSRSAFQQAQDLSPDGKTLVYVERAMSGYFDIWTLPLSGPGEPAPFLQSPFDKKEVRFSPDGRFLAFISNESGQAEAYVTPFPGPGEKVRLSSEGARLLQWSRDGKTLYYAAADGRMMALPIATNPTLKTGPPTPLFTIAGKPWLNFRVSRDGTRFLAVVPESAADEQPMTVVVDWPGSLKK
ncbi:MAG TPA: LpqB family beta-propeller domain-containing protein, partial [Thermoanaerobaculia bacterium]|nr:LpqB family beta-propeller domain-containing protein [Thermoanaerobaculia bacterium]